MAAPNNILLIAVVAGGGGDIAFAARALHALTAHGHSPALAIVVQSGLCAESVARALLDACGTRPSFVGAWMRTREGAVSRVVKTDAAATLSPSAVLQAPLRCFACATTACAALGITPAVPPRWLSVREFGQQAFIDARDVGDVSAGLARGELGVWGCTDVPLPPPLPHDALHCPSPLRVFVGYTRTARHCGALARLVASVLALEGGAPVVSPPEVVRVLAPISKGSLDAFVSGLRAHPAITSVTPKGDVTECAGAEAVYHISVAAGGSISHEAFLRLEDVHALSPFERAAFQSLLASAAGAVVTGDATLNEVLAFGAAAAHCDGGATPWWYSAEPHKVGVANALTELAGAGAFAIVRAWWAFVDGRSASTTLQWHNLREVTGGKLAALRSALADFCHATMQAHGHLGDAIVERLTGAAVS